MIKIDEQLIARITLDEFYRCRKCEKNKIKSNHSTIAILSHIWYTFENNQDFVSWKLLFNPQHFASQNSSEWKFNVRKW